MLLLVQKVFQVFGGSAHLVDIVAHVVFHASELLFDRSPLISDVPQSPALLPDLILDLLQFLLLPGQLHNAACYQMFKFCGEGLPRLAFDDLQDLVGESH